MRKNTLIDSLVRTAYDNMVENGYDGEFKDDDFIKYKELAIDMQRCDSELELFPIEEIEAALKRMGKTHS